MIGLEHPQNLAAWHAWQRRQNAAREIKAVLSRPGRARRNGPSDVVAHVRGEAPKIAWAVDSTAPTKVASLIRPLEHVKETPLLVLAPRDISGLLPGAGWTVHTFPGTPDLLTALGEAGIRTSALDSVVSTGHYLPVGALVDAWAQAKGWRHWVIQHGLMTPKAPPLPENAHVLAFSREDATFWASGRTDVTSHVVGSQILYEAAALPSVTVRTGEAPVFLGQLHGAELNRALLVRSTYRFVREHDAVYRPHPGEKDLVSRTAHRVFEARGIHVDRSGIPLTDLRAPVVSTFSTGVLEAAARGLDAWVHHAKPPRWLREFWDRYGLSPWGTEPTQAPDKPQTEPARTIADVIAG